jgi:hypothetical protein
MNHKDTETQRIRRNILLHFPISVPRCLCGSTHLFPLIFSPQITQMNADKGISPSGFLSAISA